MSKNQTHEHNLGLIVKRKGMSSPFVEWVLSQSQSL
jgi:hypothetical protein